MIQYIALVILFMTAIIITTDPSLEQNASAEEKQASVLGLSVCMGATILSGLAGAIVQYHQQDGRRDSLLFSGELGAFSVLFLGLRLAVEYYALDMGDGARLRDIVRSGGGLFHGVTPSLFIPLTANALGGIVVGKVIQHAGGVNKGYGLIGGVLLSAVARVYVEGKVLSERLYLSIPLTLLAMWLNFSQSAAKLNTWIVAKARRKEVSK